MDGGALLVFGIVAILAAAVGIVAVVGEGTAGTGIEAGAAAITKVRGDVRIAVVTAHQRGIGEQQADGVPCTIFTRKEPLAASYHTFARCGHHARQLGIGQRRGRYQSGFVTLKLQLLAEAHQVAQGDKFGTRRDAVATVTGSRLLGEEEWFGDGLPEEISKTNIFFIVL